MLTAAGCGSGGSKTDSASTSPSATPSGTPTPSATVSPSVTPSAKIVSGPVPALSGGTGFNQKPIIERGDLFFQERCCLTVPFKLRRNLWPI